MSYRNPQRIIDNRISIINKGIQTSLSSIAKSRQSFLAAEEKKIERTQAALNKVSTNARMSFDNAYQKAKTAADAFTSGLSDTEGKSTTDAIKFSEQIEDILNGIGNNLWKEIKAAQDRNGSADEINKLKNGAIAKMNKFTTDMGTWEAARLEYMKAKGIPAGQPGSLVDNALLQKNPDLIDMFEAALDEKEDNLYISIDEGNGNTRISSGKITTENGKKVFNTRDISTWVGGNPAKDGSFFLENKEFDAEGYNDMQAAIGELKGDKDLLIDGKNELDKEKVREYLLGHHKDSNPTLPREGANPAGETFMNGYRHEPEFWTSVGVENEDEYLDRVFDVGFDLYFNNTQTNLKNNKNAQTLNR